MNSFFIKCIACTFLFVTACGSSTKDTSLVAEVGESRLYIEDIQKNIPENFSGKDSLIYIENFTKNWVKRQLLLEKAVINIEQDDQIEKLVEKYKESLLLFNYEKRLIAEKLDTSVVIGDILSAYEEHKPRFLLKEPILKLRYVKIPVQLDSLVNIVRKIYTSDEEESIMRLNDICVSNTLSYNLDTSKWVPLSFVKEILDIKVKDSKGYFKRIKKLEKKDEKIHYFLSFKEVLYEGDTIPVSYVYPRLKQLVLDERKMKLLKKTKQTLFLEAQDKNKYKIYLDTNAPI